MIMKKWTAIFLSAVLMVSATGFTVTAEMDHKDFLSVKPLKTVAKVTDSNAYKATPPNATYVSSEKELKEAVKNDGLIILESDIKVTEEINIASKKKLQFNGNGKKIYTGENSNIRDILWIGSESEVSLEDIILDTTGMDLASSKDPKQDYYAIMSSEKSTLTIGSDTSIICNDTEMPENVRKGGVYLGGFGIMDGGEISGFYQGGLTVGSNAKFTLEDGLISNIGNSVNPNDGGAALNIRGSVTMNGGIISGNITGIVNRGDLIMNGGEIVSNESGLLNNNKDISTGQIFTPSVVLNGGSIMGNEDYAIANSAGGTVLISGDAYISGQFISSPKLRTVSESKISRYVILNSNNSTIKMVGGQVESNSDNESAIYNEKTGNIQISGGEISVSGTQAVAIKNLNISEGAVKVSAGTFHVSGNGSQLFDSQSYIEIPEDVEISGGESGRYFISVSNNRGGSISPSSHMAEVGADLHFTFKPDSGFKIKEVIIDGVSKGAIDFYDLAVEGRHSIVVTFESKPSVDHDNSDSGDNNHSDRSKNNLSSILPETPGTWNHDQIGWRIMKDDGSLYMNTWVYTNGHWYWIGAEGYMLQGWNLINEKWYYLYEDGTLAVSTTTPDGYSVDGAGAWIV